MAVDIYIRKNRPTKNDNLFFRRESKIENDIFFPACAHKRVAQLERWVAWPSGLRRWFKAPVLSRAWVRIPPLPNNLFWPALMIKLFEVANPRMVDKSGQMV